MRYALDIAYNGTNYAGWQIQENAHTVQAELEKALATLLREPIETLGAGRTDSGVHAKQLIVHFDYHGEFPSYFFQRLNNILPPDIAVNSLLLPKNQEFNARFDAINRAYRYIILPQKNPFKINIAWHYRKDLDLEKMNLAAKMLREYTDFGCFAKSKRQTETDICYIYYAEWSVRYNKIVFFIRANRFLRGMVRAIVGTMMLVGTGKISLEEFRAIIESKDRTKAGPSAPADGLFLVEVNYPPDSFEVLETWK